MTHSNILLRGGTVLYHGDDDHITPLYKTDILVSGDTIAKIGSSLKVPPESKVVDCTNKIISPGFIDTHHHLWQTQLKGRHADETLLDYFPTGMLAHYSYTAADMYWGQLGGCLQALDGGTTTVVDHFHGAVTADHATKALAATCHSNLRSMFCYCYIIRVASWDKDQCTFDQDLFPDWANQQVNDLLAQQPLGENKTVHVGFGFDFFFLPREVVTSLFARLRKAGVRLITTHVGKSAVYGQQSSVKMMRDYGLLENDILVSHGNNLSTEEYQILHDAGIHISTTPHTEMQMAMGWPVAFTGLPNGGGKNLSCLGVDCHTSDSSFMPDMMKSTLQAARARDNQKILEQEQYPGKLTGSVEEAFSLGTIRGARALRMEDTIGSIAVGKLADLVVFDTTSPGMVCAEAFGPVVAVVRHSSPSDAEMVLVGGKVVKEGGRLVDVKGEGGKTLSWAEIGRELGRSQKEILGRLEKLDTKRGKETLVKMWHINEKAIV